MATLQLATVSTSPKIDRATITALENVLENYYLGAGVADTVEGHVRGVGTDGADPTLSIHGYGDFRPVGLDIVAEQLKNQHGEEFTAKPPDAREAWIEEQAQTAHEVHYEEFLADVAKHITEKLVVQTVGFEKLRFPVVAHQHSVTPDGEIDHQSFEW